MSPFQKLLRLASTDPALRQDLVPILHRHRSASAAQDPKIDHGYDQPLAGGTDVMKRLQDQLLIEQGREPRESNPRLASTHTASEVQRGIIKVLASHPEVRRVVLDGVKRYAASTGNTIVVNAAVDDILDAAVAVALDPARMGQILAKHTTRE